MRLIIEARLVDGESDPIEEEGNGALVVIERAEVFFLRCHACRRTANVQCGGMQLTVRPARSTQRCADKTRPQKEGFGWPRLVHQICT
jgi:hypothetical protein